MKEAKKIKSSKKIQKEQELNYIFDINLDDSLRYQVQEDLIPFIQERLTLTI